MVVLAIVLFGAAVADGWNEVRVARARTPGLVAAASEKYGTDIAFIDMPAGLRDAFLKVQDPKFRSHKGVDLTTPGAGMTTITQGLVKLLYFPGGFKPGIAKIRQTRIAAYALDDLVAKNDQFNLFLNAMSLGTVDDKPVHGLEAAAEETLMAVLRLITEADPSRD